MTVFMLIDGKITDKKKIIYYGHESTWERIQIVNNEVALLRNKNLHKIKDHTITFYATESSKLNKK